VRIHHHIEARNRLAAVRDPAARSGGEVARRSHPILKVPLLGQGGVIENEVLEARGECCHLYPAEKAHQGQPAVSTGQLGNPGRAPVFDGLAAQWPRLHRR